MSHPESLHYSVVKYVGDPVRNEPINIGVIIVGLGNRSGGRFLMGRTGLDPASREYHFLQEVIESYHIGEGRDFNLDRLRELYEESTNMIQFTNPVPCPGDPEKVLNDIFQRFVVPQ